MFEITNQWVDIVHLKASTKVPVVSWYKHISEVCVNALPYSNTSITSLRLKLSSDQFMLASAPCLSANIGVV